MVQHVTWDRCIMSLDIPILAQVGNAVPARLQYVNTGLMKQMGLGHSHSLHIGHVCASIALLCVCVRVCVCFWMVRGVSPCAVTA